MAGSLLQGIYGALPRSTHLQIATNNNAVGLARQSIHVLECYRVSLVPNIQAPVAAAEEGGKMHSTLKLPGGEMHRMLKLPGGEISMLKLHSNYLLTSKQAQMQ